MVTVPNEAKVYTTTYEDFKGVDFTNDASNVWKRRSPSGLNMLPDIDGRPYKRKGWTVDVPYTEFIEASGQSVTSFVPKRIHHFSYGGQDYMMFFNSLGVFYMSENSGGVVKCQLAEKSGELITHSDFPPLVEGEEIEADPGRSFFFEGNGTAAFYTFVGTEMFRFDGQYFWRVQPKVPIVLIACNKYGVGEMYEPINLLTRQRAVQYMCNDLDEETPQVILPSGAKGDEAVIELLQADGSWQVLESGYTISDGVVTFTTAPPVVAAQEDNMRITYTPDGGYIDQSQTTGQTGTRQATETAEALYDTYTKRERLVTVTVNPKYRRVVSTTHGAWGPSSDAGAFNYDAQFKVTNITSYGSVSISPSGGKVTFNPYADSTIYRPETSTFISSGTKTVTTSHSGDSKYGTSKNSAAAAKANITKNGQYTFSSYYDALEDLYKRASNDTTGYICYYETETTKTEYSLNCTMTYTQYYTYSASTEDTGASSDISYETGSGEYLTNDASAFTASQRAFVYGSGMYNQVFMSASTFTGYQSRVWYSMASDPTYFPDRNYIEAGGDDTHIVGMMKVSGHVGIIKQGSALDASVYLAYPTSFENDTTFALTQSINGVGALSNGAFNILNAEPLFLAAEGIMGIEVSNEEVDRKIRSRSHYINKRLCAEEKLEDAFSYVHKGLYYLCINNHCYVLDGSQKTSWANEKTNLQYECYYLDNIPAQCFSSMGGDMYFVDAVGNLCRFKTDKDEYPYRDSYSVAEPDFEMDSAPVNYEYELSDFETIPVIGNTIRYGSAWYTVTNVSNTVTVADGVPIKAVWSTLADDDGAVHYFKNLNKKGCLVSLLPDEKTGATVYLKADEKDAVRYGEASVSGHILPYELYVKKKIKKYKRLQIICENNKLDEGFGIDQIIKSYTLGNYSKNRG